MKKLIALLAVILSGCSNSGYEGPAPSNEPTYDWDKARAEGYSEADIDAAKAYSAPSFQNASPDQQTDTMIYNTLKQMGYTEAQARQGVIDSRD
jgi:PBP1b-binding outer membrane lipoprotein LpoB